MRGRSAVWQFAISGLLGVLVIGLIASLAFREIARQQALDEAKDLARLTASAIVEPGLNPGIEKGEPAAIAEFDRIVRRSVLADSDIVRVKIWKADGTVIYSDEPRAIGMDTSVNEEELEALRSNEVRAEVSDLDSPENRYERGHGELLEVYLPVSLPDGERLMFESYQPTSVISETTRDLTLAFIPALIGGLILLQLVNLPLARRLVNQVRSARAEREQYLQAAMDASERERRRIAADLHDGVVQDMNGLSLSVAAEARAAEARGDEEGASRLRGISASGRQITRGLRNALVNIYPPTLHRQGLAAALSDLAEELGRRGIEVELDLDDSLELAPDVESLLFRIAQESTRNVVSHAAASSVRIEVSRADGRVAINVRDNGEGFNVSEQTPVPAGHLGLKAMESLTADAGGTFVLDSTPGEGTEIRVEVPAT
ncbi:MAG: sensor histidine kinase [Solirubrobacterales bacterium]